LEQHNVSYHGVDIVASQIKLHQQHFGNSPRIRFSAIDAVAPLSGRLPKADLVVCREALQHMPPGDATRVLKHISESGSKQLLTTTYHNLAEDANTKEDVKYSEGENTLINLQLPPYNLPAPIKKWPDGPHWLYKRNLEYIGLWELPLQAARTN
jgi:hypothetical protein